MEAVETISEQELNGIALIGIIAEAIAAVSDWDYDKWQMYEYAKDDIYRLNLTSEEYERAINLLTEALEI